MMTVFGDGILELGRIKGLIHAHRHHVVDLGGQHIANGKWLMGQLLRHGVFVGRMCVKIGTVDGAEGGNYGRGHKRSWPLAPSDSHVE